MKGIIFAGCSFTWGQGLYYYSDLKTIPTFDEWVKDYNLMGNAPINYKNTIRFPRIVSNHFSTYEVCRETNGGSDEASFMFIDVLFEEDREKYRHQGHLTSQFYKYEEIEYIIFQSSQPQRCSYKIVVGDVEYKVYINDNQTNRTRVSKMGLHGNEYDLTEKEGLMLVYKWLIDNELTIDEFYLIHLKNQVNTIKNNFKFYESKNIKTKLLLWPNDLLELVLSDDYLSERLIPLFYQNKIFKTIDELFSYDGTLIIEKDFMGFSGSIPKIALGDRHPSKKCHEIIADSVIKSIEGYEIKKPLI